MISDAAPLLAHEITPYSLVSHHVTVAAPCPARVLPTIMSHHTAISAYRAPIATIKETVAFPTAVSTPPPWPPPAQAPAAGPLFKFYGPKDGVDNPSQYSARGHDRWSDFGGEHEMKDHGSACYGGKESSLPEYGGSDPLKHPQNASQYDAMAAELEIRVEASPQSHYKDHNLEAQLRELLEGQRCIQDELNHVKAQVSSNHNELEVLRQCSQGQAPDPHSQYYRSMQEDFQAQQFMPQEPYHDQHQDLFDARQDGFESRQVRFQEEQELPLPTQRSHYQDMSSPAMSLRNLGYQDNSANMSTALSKMSTSMSSHARTLHGHLQSGSLGPRNSGAIGTLLSRSKAKFCC